MSSLWNPTIQELQDLLPAVDGAQITNYGSWNVDTRTVSPSKILPLSVDFMPLSEKIDESLEDDTIVVDGNICPTPGSSLHVRLEVPSAYPHLALAFKKTTYQNKITRANTFQDPDITVLCNPDIGIGKITRLARGGFTRAVDNRAVLVGDSTVYVAGSDLFEDVIAGLVKSAGRSMAQRHGAILPGAIKQVRSSSPSTGFDRRFIILGDNGSGLTRTAFGGDRSGIQQDGFVQLMALGMAYPVLNASNANIFQLDAGCPALNKAVLSGNCLLENAFVQDGYVDLEESFQGRAIINIEEVEDNVKLDKELGTDTFVILVNDDNLIPAVAKLDASQFVAMTLSNMQEWGLTTQEANNIHRSLSTLKNTEFYVINTGEVGHGRGVVTEGAVQSILKEIARGSIQWKTDRALGWEVCPHQIQHVDTYALSPAGAFAHDARFNEYLALQGLYIDRTREYIRSTYEGLASDVYDNIARQKPSTQLEILHAEAVERGDKVFEHPVTGEIVSTELSHWTRGYCCNGGSSCEFCPYK